MANEFTVEILEDGTVKIQTGAFDGAVHLAADKAMAFILQELGGEVTRTRLPQAHVHEHSHSHEHKHHKH